MIWQMIEDWFRGILTDGILSNLSGLFDSVNTEVGEIATQVGTTPAGWNAGIFNMIRSLSENVIVPIAGVIITFVMCYELIQLVIEKNNLHDLDTWIFFKWIFKTFVAVLLVTNTWNIVMGVFDITQSVVNDSAGVIISDTSIDIATVITDIEAKLDAMSVGGLLGLWFQSLFVGLTMKALSICIMLVVYGRMIEIYLVTSIAPIPVATMVNREWGGMGQNYLKSLLALGFQAFLILVCVGIYAVLIQTIAATDDISGAIWSCMGYIDEFHLLLKEEQTAAYSVEIWKRFRKWGGIPTGITQNVKDLLSSREVENIFENSDFVYMLNQAQGDREILAKQLNISQQQMTYVTHSDAGEGLIFYGNVILPFIDRFPQDTELYRVMTTKPGEVSA